MYPLKKKGIDKKKSHLDELESKYTNNIYKKFLKGANFAPDKSSRKSVTEEMIIQHKDDHIVLSHLMSKAIFSEVTFHNLSFSGITMIKTTFLFSDLRGCDFSKTTLKNCDFSFAILRGANFSNAIMIDCIFRHVDIKNTNFDNTDMLFCDFTHATF